jgi:hypothetical protein
VRKPIRPDSGHGADSIACRRVRIASARVARYFFSSSIFGAPDLLL